MLIPVLVSLAFVGGVLIGYGLGWHHGRGSVPLMPPERRRGPR